MRMLLYVSPILWSAKYDNAIMNMITKLNPIYYIVQGYRESIFFNKTPMAHPVYSLYFWGFVLIMFILGSCLMYRFRRKFIDMI